MEKYSQLGRSHLHSSGMQQLEMLKDGLKVSSIVDCKGDGRGRGGQTNIPLKVFNHNASINGGGLPLSPLAPQHNVINDLIPYPASAISTVIEKVTGSESLYAAEGARMVVSNSSSNSATLASPGRQSPPASEPEKAKRRPKLESSSSSAHLKKEDTSIEGTIINSHHNHQQQSSSPSSSTSSEQSEKVRVLEGTATTSQQQTISANDAKVVVVYNNNSAASASFDSDDIGRIVKLLQAKRENSTQTEEEEQVVQQCNQYVQVSLDGLATRDGDDGIERNDSTKRASSSSSSTVAELTRSNQTLRSTVDQLSYIVEQMSRERSTTTLQMHALSKTVSAREAKIAELAAEREKVQADGDELRFALRNFESLVADYQGSLQARAGELEAAQKELAAANVEKTQLLSRLEQARAELRAREALLTELYRVNGLNQEEMAAARQYCASLADQLEAATKMAKDDHKNHQLQERQRRMTQRLQGCRASAAELRTEVQSLRTSTVAQLQSVMAEWTARKEDLVRKMEVASLFCQSSPSSNCERLSSPKPLSRLHTSIEDIRQELTSLQESLTAHTLPSH